MDFLKNNFKRLTLTILVILVLIFGFVKIRAQGSTDSQKFNPKKDRIVTPIHKDIKDELTLAGSVDAGKKVDLRFQTAGQLAWVGVREGDKVKKWQAIASLNKDELKKKLQMDFNNYKSSLSNFDDTQDKYQSQKDSLTLTDEMKRILGRSQNTLDNSVINYELSDLAIRYATLSSPIDGIVTHVDQPYSGVNITPATATFSIVDPQSVYFKSEIDQEAVTKIKVGQPVSIRLDSFSDKTISSKITYIAFTPIAGQSSTVYEVRFELPAENNELDYRLGMDGDASIILSESATALTIPTDSVRDDNGQSFVFIKQGDQLNKKYIKTGIETDTDTEVLEGLSQNDQVVIKQK